MKKILAVLIIIFLSGCSDGRQQKGVKNESGYVGKTYMLKKAVVYVRNLPRNKNLPDIIAWNTSNLLADKATLQIKPLIKNSFGTLRSDWLVQPIRNEYVPGKTKFKVIGEYRSYRNRFPLGSSNIHMLLLENRNHEIVEISKLSFENLFLRDWTEHQVYLIPDILETKRDLYYIEKYGTLRVVYCPHKEIEGKSNYKQFIQDFALEKEFKITDGYNYCDQGVTLNFTTSQSYLTAKYYFFDWELYGDWYTITGSYLHDNNNTIVRRKYHAILLDFRYEGYEIFSKMD